MRAYLDHAATSPLRAEALAAMLPYLERPAGNPSSAHAEGRRARAALDEAHEVIAACLGAGAREIVMTSGATEAINLALKGAAWAAKARGNQLITTAVEHHAVLHALRHLEKFGFEVVELPVDRYGRLDPDQLGAAIGDRTVLVSLQLANNEVGTIQPIAEALERVRHHKGILVHLDAVAAAPFVPIDLGVLDADLLSVAAHKLEGPAGAGALFVRRGTTIMPQAHGGSQERYRRAGTEDVASAVGFAAAFRLAVEEREATRHRLRRLRERLSQAVTALPGVELSGHPRDRLPGLLSVVAQGIGGAEAVAALDLEGVAASTGSACTTGSPEPSHVLTAMGFPDDEARGALRFSLGRPTSEEELAVAIDTVPRVLADQQAARAALAEDPLGQGSPA
ncbi:MAG TPA: cysteine desulfurase family protein [Candidatus Limnocylindrales bacterium]|nr:cysteine desulfurase family protein [Candidatus Limnocylindrales bacterium]